MPKYKTFICKKCNKIFYTKNMLNKHVKDCDIIKMYDESYNKKIKKLKQKKLKLNFINNKKKTLKNRIYKHNLKIITDKIKQVPTVGDSIHDAKLKMFSRNISDILDGKTPSTFKYPMDLKSRHKKYKRRKTKRKKTKRKKTKRKKTKRKKTKSRK